MEQSYGPPNGLAVFAAGVIFLSLFIFVIWGIPSLIDKARQRRTTTPAALPRQKTLAYVPQESPPATAQPVMQDDTRRRTLIELAALPDRVPMLQSDAALLAIPLILTSNGWHWLRLDTDGDWGIFGTRGSGKGNVLQHIALNALSFGPDAVRLVVIDAKGGLDYGFCRRIQHAFLFAGDQSRVSGGLDYLLAQMHERIDLLANADARNLPEYKRITGITLPWIVAIYDEIGDFDKDQRTKIETLARMGRAEGIIGFYATQYPTAEVLTNQIQANVTNRLVCRITSSEYTRVSLRRQKSDNGLYEPSVILKTMPGSAVLRSDGGDESIGRAPEVTDEWRQSIIGWLVYHYPKTETPEAERLLAQVDIVRRIDENELVQEWIEAGYGLRDMARRLYRIRNNIPENEPISYKGDGDIFYEIKQIVAGVKA